MIVYDGDDRERDDSVCWREMIVYDGEMIVYDGERDDSV